MKLVSVERDTVTIQISLKDLKDLSAIMSLASATLDATAEGIEDDRLAEINSKLHEVTMTAYEVKLKMRWH